MTKSIYAALLLIIFTSVLSCSSKDVTNEVDPSYKYPIAAFSYTGNDGPAPVEIQFNNHSETIIADSCTYLWKFGEHGATSTEKNPTHTFYNNGSGTITVLISMTVHDLVSNLSQTRSITIDIQPSNS